MSIFLSIAIIFYNSTENCINIVKKGIGGRYKNIQNSIVEQDQNGNVIEIFKPLPPYETPKAIEDICRA